MRFKNAGLFSISLTPEVADVPAISAKRTLAIKSLEAKPKNVVILAVRELVLFYFLKPGANISLRYLPDSVARVQTMRVACSCVSIASAFLRRWYGGWRWW